LLEQLLEKELRVYQSEAVDIFLKEKQGMLNLPTGAGKTLLTAEIIRRLGFKTLFVVNKIDLAIQAKDVLKKSLGVDIGMIGMGENDIKPITVATVQSLNSQLDSFKDYLSTIRMVVFDECHSVASSSYRRLRYHLKNVEFVLGLSATTFRTDKKDMNLEAAIGPVIHKIDVQELIDKGYLSEMVITFVNYDVPREKIKEMEQLSKKGLVNETEDYGSFYQNFIVHNQYRNDVIKKLVEENKGKQILLTTKLIEHGRMLSEFLGCEFLYGETEKDLRKDILDRFKKKELNVVVGSLMIFGEGLDIPCLDLIINCSGHASDVRSIQLLGRAMRKTDTKNVGRYLDFIDHHRFFKRASFKRINIFKKQGYHINYIY
jgi:superfamily II DNA or RNA helicase